jgi:hypothetical protein
MEKAIDVKGQVFLCSIGRECKESLNVRVR